MRRTKTVLGVVAVMAAMLVVFAAPAMADDLDFDGFEEDGFFVIVDCDDDFFFDDCNNNDDFEEDGFFFGGGDSFGDFEQEAESGDIDQSFYVSGTGDNSNQTVGIQGVANTGNAQNQIGVVDSGGFGEDFNANDEDGFFCEDLDGNGFCEDLEEFCEDFNGDGICDFFFGDDDFERFDGDDDEFFFFGDDDGGDFEFEDVGASIEVSPTNTVTSDQQVNQAASAFGGKK